jgi:hemoglobin
MAIIFQRNWASKIAMLQTTFSTPGRAAAALPGWMLAGIGTAVLALGLSLLPVLLPLDAACADPLAQATPLSADDSLYRALGQKPGIVAIVGDMYDRVLVDPRIRAYFVDAPQKRIKQKLAEQICVLAGGPCQYTGRTMAESHKGLGIDQPAFNALVEDLQLAMDKYQVPYREQNKLLAKLAPMYRVIIEK